MNIVFMGTPDFAVGTLETLINSEHDVTAVVTQPDKPKGRGWENDVYSREGGSSQSRY